MTGSGQTTGMTGSGQATEMTGEEDHGNDELMDSHQKFERIAACG